MCELDEFVVVDGAVAVDVSVVEVVGGIDCVESVDGESVDSDSAPKMASRSWSTSSSMAAAGSFTLDVVP